MLLIIVPEELHEYLLHVFERHVTSGIPSQELIAASELYKRISQPQQVDFSNIGKVTAHKTENGVELDIAPESEA